MSECDSTTPAGAGKPAERRTATLSRNLAGRGAAIIEVLLAFSVVHLAYRSFKHFTDLGRLEVASRLNFSAGTAMILYTVAVLLVSRRDFAEYGLTLKGWKVNLNVGLFWTMVLAAAGLALALSPVRLDPLHPPDLPRTLAASFGLLVLTLLLALFLMRERGLVRHIPPLIGLLVLASLLSLPLVLAGAFGRPILNVFLTVLWLFFGAGIGEEVFFRGYIQSRINESFGRPFRLLGVQFGAGLIVSSLLFGFIHALNTVDYFRGRFDFAWLWMVASFCSGLFYGVMRERTGSVLAGAVVHGLEDVLGRIPSLLP
jgi:membrane protease YdiL (CAAX protease family)